MRIARLLMVIAGVVVVAPATSAKAPGPLVLVVRGLERATAHGHLDPGEAARYRRIAAHAVKEAPKLPSLRAATLRGVLRDVAAQWRGYTEPRALALFSMLAVNEHELAVRPLPRSGTDVLGPGGVVYRFVPGHGYGFHPLANFARLNKLVLGGDRHGAAELASALVARAVVTGQRAVWEYPFPFGRGKPPWTSGMAQAVAAQALARAGSLLGDPVLLDTADAAFRAIPGRLVRQLPSGPWIELYSFDRLAVLNAQLQAVISLTDYAELSGSADASVLAGRLQTAAQALLPSFDTGYWSLYALDGRESPLAYHDYVIELLRRVAARTDDDSWRDVAERFEAYERQPPVLRPEGEPATVYPVPADGHLDAAPLRFWLSKLSRVTLRAGGSAQVFTLGGGTHVLEWAPGGRTPGLYRPRLEAVDVSGNRARAALPPVRVRFDSLPPHLDWVRVTPPAIVSWKAIDEGTPWLDAKVLLAGGGKRHTLRLGTRDLEDWTRLKLPPGRWHAILVLVNSAGSETRRSLGYLPR
jgi:D-glucuronyl C5-epimerase C-terminus